MVQLGSPGQAHQPCFVPNESSLYNRSVHVWMLLGVGTSVGVGVVDTLIREVCQYMIIIPVSIELFIVGPA